MCSERYADDIPLRLPNTQLPPTLLLFSKQSNGMPASFSFFAAAMPDEPAPITQAVGRVRGLISGRVAESDSSVNFGPRDGRHTATAVGPAAGRALEAAGAVARAYSWRDGSGSHAHRRRHLERGPLHALRRAARRRPLPRADPS